MSVNVNEIAQRLYRREHIAVIGTSEQLEEAAGRYDWRYLFGHDFEPQELLLAAINLHTRDIIVFTNTSAEYEGVRETIINYSRYGRPYHLDNHAKLEDLFLPEYEWTSPDVNPRVLAENIDRWCRMLRDGFAYSRATLDAMLAFCQLNELYAECALVEGKLAELG